MIDKNQLTTFSISIYRDELEAIDKLVEELKEKGHRRVTRSSVVRHLMRELDGVEWPKVFA